MNQHHTAPVAAEPKFEFRSTASIGWSKETEWTLLSLSNQCSGDFRAQLYWGHHNSEEVTALLAQPLGFRPLPTQFCPASCLAIVATNQEVWELALPPPAHLWRSRRITPLQSSDLRSFGALFPSRPSGIRPPPHPAPSEPSVPEVQSLSPSPWKK